MELLKKVSAGLLMFLTSLVISYFVMTFAASDDLRAPAALGGFVLMLFGGIYLRRSNKILPVPMVLTISLLVILGSVIWQAPSMRFLSKISPSLISLGLGVLGALAHSNFQGRKRIVVPLVMLLFPLLLNFQLYALWVHKVEFGTFSGQVAQPKQVDFALPNKAQEIIANESLLGKVILFDFWFIGCGPCYVKFPELQRIYEKYRSNNRIAIYAVNRFMEGDKPGEAFESLEKRDYTFPVLLADQEVMDAFGVYKYPTIILINTEGQVVFMGKIDEVEAEIEQLLDEGT